VAPVCQFTEICGSGLRAPAVERALSRNRVSSDGIYLQSAIGYRSRSD